MKITQGVLCRTEPNGARSPRSDHLVERCGTHLSQGQCLGKGTATNTQKLGDGTTRKKRFGQGTISIHCNDLSHRLSNFIMSWIKTVT